MVARLAGTSSYLYNYNVSIVAIVHNKIGRYELVFSRLIMRKEAIQDQGEMNEIFVSFDKSARSTDWYMRTFHGMIFRFRTFERGVRYEPQPSFKLVSCKKLLGRGRY